MSRTDFLAVAFIFWKSSILATFALKLSENCIFEHNSKLLFEWVLETEISTRFRVLFSRRNCGCHSDNQFENLLLREEKEQPVGHFYRLWVTTLSQLNLSVDQTNTKSDVAIHRYSLNPRDRSGWKRRNIPSVQFQFLHHGSFRKPKYLDLKQFMLAIKKYVCEQGALIK